MARILILDDEEGVCSFLEAVFQAEGHVAYSARDGREGCEVAAQVQPDLVIVDIWMPRCEGLETVRLLRDQAPQAKIIVISGQPVLANVSLFKIACSNGAHAALAKPFTAEEILGLANEVLEGRRSAATNGTPVH